MAWLQERSESYRVVFRFQGKQRAFTLGKVSKAEAEAKLAQVDYLLMRLRQRLLTLPPGVDIETFIQFDGVPPVAAVKERASPAATLDKLRDRYLEAHSGALEANTLYTARIHLNHLADTLGCGFPLAELSATELQRHVDRRSKVGVSPVTIRKEINGLRTAWNWGKRIGLVEGPYPNDGLVYHKTDEKPPFQTMEEIARQVGRGGLAQAQIDELWECLFLTLPEIAELLEHVKAAAMHAWIYPMVCFAAHTGARRSEMLRARVDDIDFDGETVIIREKKRSKGRRTTRRAPLSPMLSAVLKEWLTVHPGGQTLFCHASIVERSRKRSRTTGHKGEKTRASSLSGRLSGVQGRDSPEVGPLSEREAHDHFKRTLSDSKWEVLKGWHVLRHSFVTCCVASGVDQRLIDDWVGHTTEEMRRRYRHLVPSVQKQAIRSVFG